MDPYYRRRQVHEREGDPKYIPEDPCEGWKTLGVSSGTAVGCFSVAVAQYMISLQIIKREFLDQIINLKFINCNKGICTGVVVVDEVSVILGRWVGYQGQSGYTLLYVPLTFWLTGGFTVNSQK